MCVCVCVCVCGGGGRVIEIDITASQDLFSKNALIAVNGRNFRNEQNEALPSALDTFRSAAQRLEFVNKATQIDCILLWQRKFLEFANESNSN
jgi:hypothetical protein